VIHILFSRQQQQKIQFRTSILSQNEVKPLLICLVNLDSRFLQVAKTKEVYVFQETVTGHVYELFLFTSR
jgi:hypothetical protein